MTQILFFLGFTGFLMITLLTLEWRKKINFKNTIGLFLFGILISVPFLLVEYMGGSIKYYIALLAFILIELSILFLEHRVKYFHDLIHHNIKHLRIISFLLIGLGFTYSEMTFTIFSGHYDIGKMWSLIPFKTSYALLMHTVLASAASLVHAGEMIADTLYETVFKFISYYIRIAAISVSHYLYVFSVEHHMKYLIIALLAGSTLVFFHFKKYLDQKRIIV